MSSYLPLSGVLSRFKATPVSGVVVGPHGEPRARENVESPPVDSTVISFFIVSIITVAFLLSSRSFEHWFVIPVAICGVLIGRDAVDWFRGRMELFNVAGIVGVFGFHFFFVAPMLHVYWDFWLHEFTPPPEWRNWLGYMALLNIAGISLYQITRRMFATRNATSLTYWELRKSQLRAVIPVCIAISAVLQSWIYIRSGGITGYMHAIQDDRLAFKGMGWLFMISESAPILVAFYLVLYFQNRKLNLTHLGIAMVGLFAIQMFFGGLRGSRGETVRLLFWAVGCFHFMVRKIPRSVIYGGCVFMIMFLYFYGFYKAMGTNATEAFSSSADREYLAGKTGRSSETLALGDFGRSDIQAFVLYHLMDPRSDFVYAKGRTYLGALALIVPGVIWADKPDTKLKEGTEIRSGAGSYIPDVFWSSRVYGLAGESMLNFGPWSVPIIYGLFGFLVAWVERSVRSLRQGDARNLLAPLAVYLCFNLVLVDSDNLVFNFVKSGLLPCLLVWALSNQHILTAGKTIRRLQPRWIRN